MIMIFFRQSKFSSAFSRVLILLAGLGISLGIMGRAEALTSDLTVGSNRANQTTNFTSGTNSYVNAYVGFSDSGDTNLVTNNTLVISNFGTVLNLSSEAFIGYNGTGGNSNGMIITAGGRVTDENGYIGWSNNNSYVLVTGAGSTWSHRRNFNVGLYSSGNSLVISNGGQVVNGDGYVGNYSTSSNNSVVVTGSNSLWSNSINLYMGLFGSGNSLVISNGGKVVDQNATIGNFATASNNTVVVTGSGSTWSNNIAEGSGTLVVGNGGSGNSLVISNGASVYDRRGQIGGNTGGNSGNSNTVVVTGSNSLWSNSFDLRIGNGSSGNSLIISNGGRVIVNAGQAIGLGGGNNNSVLVTGSSSLWSNNGQLYMGLGGSGNKLTINNGGKVFHTYALIGDYTESGLSISSDSNSVLVSGDGSAWYLSGRLLMGLQSKGNSLTISNGASVYDTFSHIGETGDSNTVVVTGSNSLWSNSGDLNVGYQGSGNSLVISNGGQVVNGDGYVGNYSTSSNNRVVVTGSNSLWSNRSNLYVGYLGSGNSLVISNGGRVVDSNAYIGYGVEVISSNNSVVVTGSNSLWSNSGNLFVGFSSSGNSLVISNGGKVVDSDAYIGYFAYSSNNSVVVTGSNSLWSNSGNLTVGNNGSGSLTVANEGSVWASSMIIAANSNSTGTVNIGSLGGNDTAGTLITPTITFGSGAGKLNFNQANQFTLTSRITGRGAVQQLGTGMTILSGNNSYTGTTLISAGTLRTASTNALGTSAVTLTNSGVLSLATNLTISSLRWNGSASIALFNITNGPALSIINALDLSGATHSFDFANDTQVTNAMKLMSWGDSNSYTVNDFTVQSSVSYTLSISDNTLFFNPTSGLIALTAVTSVNDTAVYSTVAFQPAGVLIVDPTANLTITSGVSPTNNGSIIIKGELTTPNIIIPDGGSTYLVEGKLNGDIINQFGGYLFIDPSTVNGSVTNSGVMSIAGVGNVITGNLLLTGSSVLEVATNAMLNVGGSATLGGSLVVSSVLPFGTKEAFLSASSIIGAFSSIEAPEGERIRVISELTGADTTAPPECPGELHPACG